MGFVSVWLGLALGLACASDTCTEGHERCPCTTEGRCLDGLVCLSQHCVDPNWTPDSDPQAGDDNAAGDGAAFDNVAACETLTDALRCGDADPSLIVDCDLYATYPCDVADYFTCVADVVTCTDDTLDTSSFSQCQDLAICP